MNLSILIPLAVIAVAVAILLPMVRPGLYRGRSAVVLAVVLPSAALLFNVWVNLRSDLPPVLVGLISLVVVGVDLSLLVVLYRRRVDHRPRLRS